MSDSTSLTRAAPDAGLGALFEQERGLIWGLGYRMTGSPADADDLVQETFLRALSSPPRDTTLAWRPWLVRVAINLARDRLRARKRRRYVGPWLPAPIDLSEEPREMTLEQSTWTVAGADHMYDWLESVSYAFLVCAEALTPLQRAVLMLCDVLEYSGREAATALGTSQGSVRVALHRARHAMQAYTASRAVPSAAVRAQTQELLIQMQQSLARGDAAHLEALLAADVVTMNDGGGVYAAARVPVRGAERVGRFYLKLRRSVEPRVQLLELNGLPAVLAEFPPQPDKPHLGARFITLVIPDASGRIAAIHTLIAPDKLERAFRGFSRT